MYHQKLTTLLRQAGHSITEPRKLVYQEMETKDYPITVQQLIASLPQVDKVSIYRTVELFEQIGIVHKVWTGFKSKIELSQNLSHHHHHFSCQKCGQITNLTSDELEKCLHQIEAQYGFTLLHHSVELNGYCSNCA